MTKQNRNNIIKTMVLGIALCFTTLAVSKPEPVQAQYIWTCYASSPVGNFVWRHPNINFARARVMHECQLNTPYGMYCVASGCE